MSEEKETLKQMLKEKAVQSKEQGQQELQGMNIQSGYTEFPNEQSIEVGLNQATGQILTLSEENQQPVSTVPTMAVDMQGAKNRILELQNFIKFMMVPNIDYGFVPGCAKPMLFKSGAEKLCDIYGLTKQVEVARRVEDWEQGVFHYEVKVTLINKKTGHIEAEGVGCCNNKEKKFASQDPFSIVNSILKMAKKRAIVDATLSVTRTSGIFSQDLETM